MQSSSSILERFYEDHADAIHRFALTLTLSSAEADDLLQEVFCRLASRPSLLESARKERSLLFRMTRNLAVDWSRRRKVREVHAESMLDEETWFVLPDDPDRKTLQRSVISGLAGLPEEQRAVLHLKIWEDFTLKEISRALSIPEGTAASRFLAGMNKLREVLRPVYEEILK